MSVITVDVPYFGEVILSTIICPLCGMKSTDVHPVGVREPARYVLQIRSAADLDVRVVRSSTSKLSIPEIGLVVEPGSALDGYITNVEGVLRKLLEVVRTMERDLGDDKERIEKARGLIGLLESVIAGNSANDGPLTLILEDPLGNGLMASSDGRVVRSLLDGEWGQGPIQ
ncbi:MAG: ZPR1 zinc finger domain-containing protein [Candidatus Thermoplasmatota archaeon]|jgi:zinc finger protein|nr:ZPR1 zinc finger domain-containing protein [Candidatus Thermoplasmatota archaeon]